MNAAKKYILARSLGTIYFWGSISIPYLVYRGFSIAEAFTVLSLYSLLVVILEFPTGVLGDYFGHKLSVILAHFTGAIAMFTLSLSLPHYGYYFVFALAGLSASLVSGSDDAYLRSISDNFRNDLALMRKYSNIVMVSSIASAGFLAQYSYSLPLLLTGIAWIASMLIIIKLPSDKAQSQKDGNIFSTALSSIKYVLASLSLITVILYSSVNEGYQFSIKTIINSSTPTLGIDLRLISLIVALGFITRTLGYQFASKLEHIRTRYLFTASALSFLLITIIGHGYLGLILVALTNFTVALVSLRADFTINDLVSDNVRASVLSLKNLFVRLFSSGYLLVSGVLIEYSLFRILMFITFIAYAITGLGFVRLTRRQS